MSKVGDARYVLAQRAHRKVLVARLSELRASADLTLKLATYNEHSYEVFGTRTDSDVADRLTQLRERIADDLTWAINRLEQRIAEEDA